MTYNLCVLYKQDIESFREYKLVKVGFGRNISDHKWPASDNNQR